ncbi:O-acetyl-ADP-ribose deacetylase [Thalassoglobus sp. JC818]|uniref:O-acetyl-ADP-ribose deacetylase n=1 Tax=Thalassoglobus sp. JC818 TaxID=3232136 RepID=UPI0034581620
MRIRVRSATIRLIQGDITSQSVDAIVNAANSQLAGGGGVDGAIHRAAGPALMEETRRRYPEGCPTGQAVITGGGNLDCRHVIHTVGPVWDGGLDGEPDLLKSAYRNSLQLAVVHNCQTVAFPAISAGVYAYPIDLAAEHSLQEVTNFLRECEEIDEVRFVLFSEGAFGAFGRVLERFEDIVKEW